MKRLAAIALGVFWSACVATGQFGRMRSEPDAGPQFLFFEPVNLFPNDSSLSRADILYRIDQSFFISVKNNDTSSPWAFISRGEVLVELFDTLDVSQARSIQRVELGSDRSDPEPQERQWYQNIATFEVPPGRYKIVFEVDDLESDRRFIDEKSTVRLKRFGSTSSETSTPLFVEQKESSSTQDTLMPVGFGPNLLFGRKSALLVQLPIFSEGPETAHVEYSVSTLSREEQTPRVELAETLASIPAYPRMILSLTDKDHSTGYSISLSESPHALGLLIPLASEKFPLRRFDLTMKIRLGQKEFDITKKFQMVWPDMPFSLRNIDYAINALKYIATDDQRDSLRSGNIEERRDKLEAFWQRRNAKPGTAFNEVMVEYYRRVDHASKTFGTLRDPDGFKSDRGRTYILYGPPTRTERTLSPTEGFQEVWTYEPFGKKFIFADQSKSGNYVLISTQSL